MVDVLAPLSNKQRRLLIQRHIIQDMLKVIRQEINKTQVMSLSILFTSVEGGKSFKSIIFFPIRR